MEHAVTIAPFHEPVSLEQAKRHLRIDGSDSDELVAAYLLFARKWCEDFTGRSFLWQTIAAVRDDLPAEIKMPGPPLVAVSSVTYTDTNGNSQTADSSLYDADTISLPGKIVLAYNQTWPNNRGHHHDVTITFIAGHAAAFTRSVNTLVVPAHLFQVNDPVQVYNIGGALPAGISAQTTYYIKAVTGHAVSLAASEGGAEIALSDAGTGTHYIDALPSHYAASILLVLTDLWMHRGDERPEPSRQIRELLSMGRMISL